MAKKRGTSLSLPRFLPFALFMAFIAAEEAARFLHAHGLLSLSATTLYYLYPVKTIVVAIALYACLDCCDEVRFRDLAHPRSAAVSAIGILTCVIWVSLDWTLPVTAAPAGFNPFLLPRGGIRTGLTVVRVAGAVLVVPVMEELFWRSYLLRYLIDPDFQSVPVGRFTWGSFLATTVLFGLEHHLFLAGMAAGAVYNLIVYRTRSIVQCILAHAVTNLALACYVLYTGKWHFW